MEINPQYIKELREKTGAGIMDCKRALADSNGDMNKAVEFLRIKGLASAEKKVSRATKDGLVTSYIHAGGKIGVMVEINCETDFVARTPDFQNLCKDIAMHIAASGPMYVKKEDVASDVINKERAVFTAQTIESGKPQNVVEKIVEGKVAKYLSEICLLDQSFVKDPSKTIEQYIKEKVALLGENISVARFARFQLGENKGD